MTLDMIVRPGLEGVIALDTRLSHIDGLAGELTIAGYPLEEIAGYATFEEMVYLLWHDQLPTEGELSIFRDNLAQKRMVSAPTLNILKASAEKRLPMMDALRIAASTLSLYTESDNPTEGAEVVVATFPTIISAYWRMLEGHDPIEPRTDLSHAANYLYMLTGETPSAERTRALNTYLNTVIEHGLNASTFAARVIIATHSDMISAIGGAIGALKGPLHGGAPGPALDMVFEIGKPDLAEPIIRQKLDAGERLMGFGHRVYKVRDPRADVLGEEARRFFAEGEQRDLYTLAMHVEQTALRLLDSYKPGRNLQTNVEFYTALILHGIGLPVDLFSPTFALARVGGWTAHALEHLDDGLRIIRPRAGYTGQFNRQRVALDQR
jgi:citrate synthase